MGPIPNWRASLKSSVSQNWLEKNSTTEGLRSRQGHINQGKERPAQFGASMEAVFLGPNAKNLIYLETALFSLIPPFISKVKTYGGYSDRSKSDSKSSQIEGFYKRPPVPQGRIVKNSFDF